MWYLFVKFGVICRLCTRGGESRGYFPGTPTRLHAQRVHMILSNSKNWEQGKWSTGLGRGQCKCMTSLVLRPCAMRQPRPPQVSTKRSTAKMLLFFVTLLVPYHHVMSQSDNECKFVNFSCEAGLSKTSQEFSLVEICDPLLDPAIAGRCSFIHSEGRPVGFKC